MEPTLATILMFGGDFAPRGWAYCDGQLLPINSNQALFSILGTTFGGDGRVTFALPDLRSRVAIHAGQGPGLGDRRLGSSAGVEFKTLTVAEMPSHTHTASTAMAGTTATATDGSPDGRLVAQSPDVVYASGGPVVAMASGTATTRIANEGGSQSFSLVQPYLGVNYIIALQGLFPSRN